MDPDPVVPLAYEQATSNPWPGIIRILAFLALLEGASTTTVSTVGMWQMFDTRSGVTVTYVGGYPIYVATRLGYAAAGIMLVIGAAGCLARRDLRTAMMIGAALMIVAGSISVVTQLTSLLFQPPSYMASMSASGKLRWYVQVFGSSFTFALLPLVWLLILFRNRHDPQLAAVFRSAQGNSA